MQQTTAAVSKGFKNLQAKLTGQKYHQNLLGESLEDMLRIATAKTLEAPDATLNQQVCAPTRKLRPSQWRMQAGTSRSKGSRMGAGHRAREIRCGLLLGREGRWASHPRNARL